MTSFAGSNNIVATLVNGALETGGNLALIAQRLISSGLVSAANLLSSINDRLYSGGASAAAWLVTINNKLTDVTADIIAAGNMNASIPAVTYDISTNAPGRRNGAIQLYSAANTREGTITVKASADGGATFNTIGIMNEITGVVTDGTVAVTNGVALSLTIKMPEVGYSDISIEYADTTGGTGAGTLKASITMR